MEIGAEEEGRRVMAVSSRGSSGRGKGSSEVQIGKKWRERDNRSPERNRVWTEAPRCDRRVPVVYYLSRNGHLDQPHFMEVPLSSPHALYLRLPDVIHRLSLLRGKAMANMYSWSSKRSYKKSFVWHDLAESDFIYPSHGQEYVLKGSELLPGGEDSDFPPVRRRSWAADASTQTAAEEVELSMSPPPSDSSPETLMKAAESGRMKASSVLMQLLSCGSMSFRDCGVASVKDQRGFSGEYFSGSLIETNKEPFPTLKRSSSYNADRSSQLQMMEKEKEVGRAKCIPRKARGMPPRKESNSNCISNRSDEHGSKRLEFQL